MTKRTQILQIHRDDDPFSPREDPSTTMVCWHSRYNLGDIKQPDNPEDYYKHMLYEMGDDDFIDELELREDKFCNEQEWTQELSDEWTREYNDAIKTRLDELYFIEELYLYDHSGISMSCGPFSCPWDSGKVGMIYISKARAEEEYGAQPADFPLTRDDRTFQSLDELVQHYLRNEVEVYDRYLRGDVYGFVLLDAHGEEIDSCWGFYGYDYKTNGTADHVDLSQVKAVHWMEQEQQTVIVAGDIEELGEDGGS